MATNGGIDSIIRETVAALSKTSAVSLIARLHKYATFAGAAFVRAQSVQASRAC